MSFNQLTDAQAEILALLAEECGEIVQVIGKILRHGPQSCHPNGVTPNQELLADELGDLQAAVLLAERAGLVDASQVETATSLKLDRVIKYLHHADRMATAVRNDYRAARGVKP